VELSILFIILYRMEIPALYVGKKSICVIGNIAISPSNLSLNHPFLKKVRNQELG
jgi:hypothetical protein